MHCNSKQLLEQRRRRRWSFSSPFALIITHFHRFVAPREGAGKEGKYKTYIFYDPIHSGCGRGCETFPRNHLAKLPLVNKPQTTERTKKGSMLDDWARAIVDCTPQQTNIWNELFIHKRLDSMDLALRRAEVRNRVLSLPTLKQFEFGC